MTWSSILLQLLVALSFFHRLYAQNYRDYCATIDASSSNGAVGYYALRIFYQNGYALHNFELDLSANQFSQILANQCTDASGNQILQYHLHERWSNIATSSSSLACNFVDDDPKKTTATTIGGHYDPYLACSTSSQFYYNEEKKYNGVCKLNERYPKEYYYSCSQSAFFQGDYAQCEVGDFSGKLGPAVSTNAVFGTNGQVGGGGYSYYTDPHPPLVVDFNADTPLTAPWSSISFQCGDTQIACASFRVNTGNGECNSFNYVPQAYAQAASKDSSSSSLFGRSSYTRSEFEAAVACSVLICLIGGLLIGGGLMWWRLKHQQAKNQKTDQNGTSDEFSSVVSMLNGIAPVWHNPTHVQTSSSYVQPAYVPQPSETEYSSTSPSSSMSAEP